MAGYLEFDSGIERGIESVHPLMSGIKIKVEEKRTKLKIHQRPPAFEAFHSVSSVNERREKRLNVDGS